MGALLRNTFRTGSTDTFFRYGGEEFSILHAETGFERVRRVIAVSFYLQGGSSR